MNSLVYTKILTLYALLFPIAYVLSFQKALGIYQYTGNDIWVDTAYKLVIANERNEPYRKRKQCKIRNFCIARPISTHLYFQRLCGQFFVIISKDNNYHFTLLWFSKDNNYHFTLLWFPKGNNYHFTLLWFSKDNNYHFTLLWFSKDNNYHFTLLWFSKDNNYHFTLLWFSKDNNYHFTLLWFSKDNNYHFTLLWFPKKNLYSIHTQRNQNSKCF